MTVRLLPCAAVAGSALLLAGRPSIAATIGILRKGTAHEAVFSMASGGETALAVGAAGQILETIDGGAHWREVRPAPTSLSLFGVAAVPGHAIAVGQGGTILIRDRNGAWRAASSGTKSRLFEVAINPNGLAVAVGEFGTIVQSRDFGVTWTSIAPDWAPYAADGAQPHLYDVVVGQDGTVMVAGEFGLILRNSDGQHWTALHKGDASIFALDLTGNGTGFAVGQNGLILRTRDGGASWTPLVSGTQAILLGVDASAGNRVLVTGRHDMLVSDDGGDNWRHVESPKFATAWFEAVASVGNEKTWIVGGQSGDILSITE